MNEAILLLGGNEGDRYENLKKAVTLIEKNAGVVQRQSSIYESEPWGFETDKFFLNMIVIIDTKLSPETLLQEIHKIEKRLGRKRVGKEYASRTIDIDILFYNDEIIALPTLQIPHPRLHERMFTLAPLCEISSEKKHPVFQKNMTTLLRDCRDTLKVYKKNLK
ncbi:MAG: 2-amino-4-hydroxy-6-hydroxymethyldihydropteridine diphosphokinase [Bacteroidales bacterium]|jgi:2-amino-4-hydroxy-6-hydroxymethyldihydropteridine diphosphokinase|nr:2-amino-4-hydroxy-6-hydroxymethyldihydropteridine diphosphokinase [Bacteroidales bacterium]